MELMLQKHFGDFFLFLVIKIGKISKKMKNEFGRTAADEAKTLFIKELILNCF